MPPPFVLREYILLGIPPERKEFAIITPIDARYHMAETPRINGLDILIAAYFHWQDGGGVLKNVPNSDRSCPFKNQYVFKYILAPFYQLRGGGPNI